ncbi:porin family protein, partial [Fulvivirga lutimaris]|uniref:porin family protein n=1 Tax=Fulvivirga lutimaris TaxID=1819566 RepID=UPI0012BB5768
IMRKIFLSTIMLLGAYGLTQAQISGGIKGGLNFANVDVSGDPDGKTGYHAGAFLNIGVAGISIQPEILYSVKGAEDFDLSYVEVPILLKKNFAKVVNIHLGPQFGFLTKAEGDFGSGSEDVKEFMKGTDLSAVFGAGLDLPMGLSAGVRYVLGLSDVNDEILTGIDSNLNPEFGEIKNKTFQIYVGYKLFGN